MSDGNKGMNFSTGASKTRLSLKLLSIKPPDIVGRLPRLLEDLKHWKATELKNWLLHYSVAVLRKILNPLFFFQWSLLVGGIGILCSDSISNDDLANADSMLQDFVLFSLDGNTIWANKMHQEYSPFAAFGLLCFVKRPNMGI